MSDSNSSIMSVGEMIDSAFGDPDVNIVNHKLLQAILYLLARQLRILERYVEIDNGVAPRLVSNSSLSVTEVKVHALMKRKNFGKSQSQDKSITDMSKPGKDSMEVKRKARKTSKDYDKLLQMIEEQREKELRIIHQRGNSREEHDSSPTPMASLDSVEAQYEKLLIVEKVPSEEARRKRGIRRDRPSAKLSVVTQEQFVALSRTVRALQEKFASMGAPEFPENIELMQELRKGASLTDAMAALQLSARLEATEKTLERMLTLVTEILKATPEKDLKAIGQKLDTEVLFGGKSGTSKDSTKPSQQQKGKRKGKRSPEKSTRMKLLQYAERAQPDEEKPDCVTYGELNTAMRALRDELLNTVNSITAHSTMNADSALKIATNLERLFDESLNLGTRMEDLEASVAEYAEQINALDTGLSSQMTNYQEQLTQMQHDLESGLENMAEVLASSGGDTNAIAELNGNFTNLQLDFDNMSVRQKDLKDLLHSLSMDLEALGKHIEVLRDTKSDRDEVVDALRDKAGIEELNGLVSLQQFDAVRGDFEKRIASAYNKFNNQENTWQKAIDELLRELDEKADYLQVVSLRDEINKYLDMLSGRINAMFDIVGEPSAAAVMRQLSRDTKCLSCSTPAHMNPEEPNIVPALPAMRGSRPPTIGADAPKLINGEGDQRLCYPGHTIPHPRDPRSHVCQRYCGGSHTVINSSVTRAPPCMTINPMTREETIGLGIDGRMYRMDSTVVKKPCQPCNVPKPPITQSMEKEKAPEHTVISSDITPSDYNPITSKFNIVNDVTPPPIFDED